MAIYEKPTKMLMREFADSELRPDQVFDKNVAVRWFCEHYPKIKANTVQMHVEGMSVNSTSRKHHPSIKAGSGHDLFFKVGPGRYRLWDQSTDPAPRYGDQSTVSPEDVPVEEADNEESDIENGVGSREFAFERDLRNYLARNLSMLEHGFALFQDEELSGVEFPVGGRFIDLLAEDGEGGLVVIELKVSRGYDRVVGQLLRYMAWVKRNLADGKRVRGFIVASELTDDLRLAASLVPDVSLFQYELALRLTPVPLPHDA
jgi:hypothetical protein